MTKTTAVLVRTGLAPLAAALALVFAFAAAPSAAEKTAATAAPEKTDAKAEAKAEPAAKSEAGDTAKADGKDSAAGKESEKSAVADKDADKEKAEKSAAAPKVPEPEAGKPAEATTTKAADAEKADEKPDDKSAGKSPEKPDTDKHKAATTAKASEPEAQEPADKSDAKTSDDKSTSDKSAGKADADKDKPPATAKISEPKASGPEAEKPAEAAGKSEDKAKHGADTKGPEATAALPGAAPDAPSTGVADAVLPPADPVVAEVRLKLPQTVKGVSEDEAAALVAFYDGLNGPAIWVATDGLTAKGKAVVKEFNKADDWGLSAADFQAPQLSGTLTPEAAADAEIKIAQLVLKYARYARGGRINPLSISQLMDQAPTLVAPKRVLSDITILDAPDAYLRSLHPKHVQFELLRQALLSARGATNKDEEEEPAEDPALSVKLPPGGIIKPGSEDEQVALLRKRLKVPAEDEAKANVYDTKLEEAVREFQRANRLRPDGIIGNNTRSVLNGQPRPEPVTADAKIERILINMERWRWLPDDLGKLYVWDNVPEALTRIVKDGKTIHTDRIIVGQPTWPTPVFSADMKTVVFYPTWGVPDGIKSKELAPLLRKSSGGFFGMFGGGYSADAVLEAYQLRAYVNGRQVSGNSIDWNSIDIRSVSFQQPPGPKNPLGDVKFMFPNKHDVYMHDTPERELFSRSFRALSHGCMRIQDPRRFAEIILGEDKGWSREKVRSMFSGYSSDVPLDTHIPVHVTYLTARVNDQGKLETYGDVYGLDSRTAAALSGRSIRFPSPAYSDEEVAAAEPDPGYQRRPGARKKQYGSPPTLADAISGLFSP